jgi:peptidylprolyl isomerase
MGRDRAASGEDSWTQGLMGQTVNAQCLLRIDSYGPEGPSRLTEGSHVPRRLGRLASVSIPSVLLLAILSACGGSLSSSASGGLGAVSLTGDVGKKIDATWHDKVARPTSTTVTTLVKGTGATIATGDSVTTYLWIGDGTTQKVAYSDYTNGSPESIPNSGQLNKVLTKLFENATYGSRVAAVTTAKDLFGSSSGNSQLGIGGNDNLVVVADLVKKAPTSPTPSDTKAHDVPASRLPKVVSTNGKPSGLSWHGIGKPSLTTPVQRVVLKTGKGALVKSTDTVTVNYLGETYQAKKPFDQSYTTKPITQSLSGLIQGWKIGLTGVKVGSRVLVQIPPAYAYGAQGSGSTIPSNATLWFVIDVVKATSK